MKVVLSLEKSIEDYLLRVVSRREKGIVPAIVRFFLFLLEQVYRFVLMIRYFIYKIGFASTKRLDCKVISIGNIIAGGTGKTPLVRLLAEELKNRNYSIVVVSRGYKSKNSQAKVVFDGNKLLIAEEEVSDEALMLSNMLEGIPIITGKDRYKAGELAILEFSPDIILLDDGFQHWQLARDKDIVLLDANNPFGYKHLLPAGLLREPLKALSRVDIFLITKINPLNKNKISYIISTLKKYNQDAEIYKAEYENKCIKLYQKNGKIKTLKAEFLSGKKVLAFSGIGNPASFQQSLEECNCDLFLHHRFPDHYQYTGKDIEEIVKKSSVAISSKTTGSNTKSVDLIITTAKDFVRLNKEMRALLIAEYNLAVLEIDMKVERIEVFVKTMMED